MKKMTALLVVAGVAAALNPVFAADKEKAAPAAKAKAVVAEAAPAAAAPVLTAEELAARSLKGVENQRAWVATLEKQLEGEKAKLAQIEAEHDRNYGGKSKSKSDASKG